MKRDERPVSPLFTMRDEAIIAASDIFGVVTVQSQESARRMNAETFISNLAAVMGENARVAGDSNPSNGGCAEQTIEFLESASRVFLASKFYRKASPTLGFNEMLKHAQKRAGEPVELAVDPYYDPHERPEISAAHTRKPVRDISKKYALSPWETATAGAMALIQALDQVAHITQPKEVAYQIAMETALGIAYQKPWSLEQAQKRPDRLTAPRNVVAACNQIAMLAVKGSSRMLGGASTREEKRQAILLTLGVTGSWMGEMAARAGMKPMPEKPCMIISADTSAFLEEAYPNFVLISGHPSRRDEKMPRFGAFASHAVASLGKHPCPNLTLAEKDRPPNWPPYLAAMLRDDVFDLAKKYKLSDWELASASVCAAMKTVEEIPAGIVKSPTAVRIVMEHAVGMSYMTPLQLDPIRKSAPEDIKIAMDRHKATLQPQKGPMPS